MTKWGTGRRNETIRLCPQRSERAVFPQSALALIERLGYVGRRDPSDAVVRGVAISRAAVGIAARSVRVRCGGVAFDTTVG